MRYPKEVLDGLKARVRLSDVVSPYVRLSRAGRYMRGLSPFKKEKTPSFFVDDERGRYTCYATQKNGDHFEFLMELQGLSFQEAVEKLAHDAGIDLPKDSSISVAQERQRHSLLDVLEAAARFFEAQLADRAGTAARGYLETRGVSAQTVSTFRLGFAPDSFSALHTHLKSQGVSEDVMVAAGLAKKRREGAGIYDVFRNRVMFPILDRSGRVIAFGGRALAADEPAKYLNSPATSVFDKSRVLYNFKAAREAYHRPGGEDHVPLLVAEGYMDVIALHDAGFGAAVAPLGTAMTEAHLALLWQISPCPRLCFDGDAAGQAAAFRAAKLALPLLKPGLSLDFVVLPAGQDPDDVLRSEGAEALAEMLHQSQPLVNVLWQNVFTPQAMASPDAKAAFRTEIDHLVDTIANPTIRNYYGSELQGRRIRVEREDWEARFQPERGPRGGDRASRSGWRAAGGRGSGQGRGRPGFRGGERRRAGIIAAFDEDPSLALKQSSLVRSDGDDMWREELVMATVLNHPQVLEDDLEIFATLKFSNQQLDKLRNQLLSTIGSEVDLDRDTLLAHLEEKGLALIIRSLLGSAVVKTNRFAAREADWSVVEKGWKDLIRRMSSIEVLHNDFLAAQEAYALSETEENWDRIVTLKAQIQKLETYHDQ